jgi:hypothetical protein
MGNEPYRISHMNYLKILAQLGIDSYELAIVSYNQSTLGPSSTGE